MHFTSCCLFFIIIVYFLSKGFKFTHLHTLHMFLTSRSVIWISQVALLFVIKGVLVWQDDSYVKNPHFYLLMKKQTHTSLKVSISCSTNGTSDFLVKQEVNRVVYFRLTCFPLLFFAFQFIVLDVLVLFLLMKFATTDEKIKEETNIENSHWCYEFFFLFFFGTKVTGSLNMNLTNVKLKFSTKTTGIFLYSL